jgi:hypothetical protein
MYLGWTRPFFLSSSAITAGSRLSRSSSARAFCVAASWRAWSSSRIVRSCSISLRRSSKTVRTWRDSRRSASVCSKVSRAAIESTVWVADDHRDTIEPRVLGRVRHHEHLGAANRGRANRSSPRRVRYLRREAISRLEPSAIVVNEADVADRASTDLRRQFRDFVIGDFGRAIHDVERAQRSQPLRLVSGDRERRWVSPRHPGESG